MNLSSSPKQDPLTGLFIKKKLHNGSIDAKYLAALKETFKTLNNTNGFSKKALELLLRSPENYQSERVNRVARSYDEIQKDLKRQVNESIESVSKIKTPIKVHLGNLCAVKIPTESHLYVKACKRRNLVNPKASAEITKRENKDFAMLKKHREQRILKNIAMKSIIDAKQRKIEKEIARTTKDFYINMQ